jgi:hypothetical protein
VVLPDDDVDSRSQTYCEVGFRRSDNRIRLDGYAVSTDEPTHNEGQLNTILALVHDSINIFR